MNTDSTKALQDIPNLIQFADKLVKLTDAMTQQAEFEEMDHLGLMSLCFVSKQIEHLRSIRILVESRQYRDAGLIARSMIEGYVLYFGLQENHRLGPFIGRLMPGLKTIN